MPELMNSVGKKIVAFYLPQFHEIPENNLWWGNGFTEWTNTRKAVPLFEEHEQPKIPLGNNYYDLSDVKVMEAQARLATQYGLYGFCYYHYWFKDGKKLLEKPVENMLKNPEVNVPFCLCWANENWSKNWDGGNREIIMEQDYGTEREWEHHLQYMLDFFRDERYILYDSKPIFIIYKPEEIPNLNLMMDYWQLRVRQEGFPGLLIIRQHPKSIFEQKFDASRIQYTIKFQPLMAHFEESKRSLFNRIIGKIERIIRKITNTEIPIIVDYDETWRKILNDQPFGDEYINGAFVSWDNTARRKKKGTVYVGSSPEKFQRYLGELLDKDSALDLVFINAWNEWAEGAYLEPDERYGYKYLEALSAVVNHDESNNKFSL